MLSLPCREGGKVTTPPSNNAIPPDSSLNENDRTPASRSNIEARNIEAHRTHIESERQLYSQLRKLGMLVGALFFLVLGQGLYAWWLTSQLSMSEQAMGSRFSSQQDSIDRLNSELGSA